jgi:hypothetical protein
MTRSSWKCVKFSPYSKIYWNLNIIINFNNINNIYIYIYIYIYKLGLYKELGF